MDDLHAELMEIDENLARSELSPAQEAAHMLRRQEIWDEIRKPLGETNCSTQKATAHKDRPQNQKQFAAELAEVTGASKVDINRKRRRARGLGDDAIKIVNTSLNSGVEMDALVKLDPEGRADLIARAEAGEKVCTGHFLCPRRPSKHWIRDRSKPIFPQPNTRTFAILVDENDAGGFQGGSESIYSPLF